MKVSLVIPVHNKAKLTKQCIQSVLAAGGPLHEIIVVDNASTDDTQTILDECLHDLASSVRMLVFVNETNIGYGPAVNKGAKAATGSVLVILNNDTIAHPGWLEALVDTLEDASVGITGAFGGFLTPDYRCAWITKYPRREVDYIEGSVLAIRRSLWETLGGFSDLFAPAYCEDTDLSIRVRKTQARVEVTPDVPIEHLGGQTSGQVFTQESFNRNLERHLKTLQALYGPCQSVESYKLPIARVCIGTKPPGEWRVSIANPFKGTVLGESFVRRRIEFAEDIVTDCYDPQQIQSDFVLICHPGEVWSGPLLDNLYQLLRPPHVNRAGTLFNIQGSPPELRFFNRKKATWDPLKRQVVADDAELFDVVTRDTQGRTVTGWASIAKAA